MLRGGGVGGGSASNPLARGPAGGSAVLPSSSGPSVTASRAAISSAQPKSGEGSGGKGTPVSTSSLSSSTAGSTSSPNPDGGVQKSTAASPVSAGVCPPAGHEAGAVDPSENKGAAAGGPLEEDMPVEFRAIGSNGSWQRSKMVIPPRRPASEPRHTNADRDPGQAKVGGLVMALQKPGESCQVGLTAQDSSLTKRLSSSSSSLSVLGEQGLVQLRRVKYSPRHSAPAASSTANDNFDA
ncbi:unnamed protein product [Scytosiphon promiscuus]